MLALVVVGQPAGAQQRSLIDPGDARLRRELRSLENRLETSPRGAGLQLDRARRDLIREGRGVDFTPEEARIDRGLDRVRRELQQRERPDLREPRLPAPGGERRLPRSYAGEPPDGGLPLSYSEGASSIAPGGSNNLVTVARLLNRADTALGAGRAAQAQSDLAAARGFLSQVEPDGPMAERRAQLQSRLADLEQRAAADS